MVEKNEQNGMTEPTGEGKLSAELDAELDAKAAEEEAQETEEQQEEKPDEFGKDTPLAEDAEDKPEEKPDDDTAQTAAEVLDETEEKPTDETVPLKTFLDTKSKMQTKIDELAGQVQVTQAMIPQAKTETVAKPKSPIEIEAEEQGIGVDEVQMTSKLYREQREFDRQQDALVQQAATATKTQEAMSQSFGAAANDMTAEKMGQGLDYKTITGIGTSLLRKGDYQNIEDADNFGTACYDECFTAIQRSGSKEQKTALQSAIEAQQSKTSPKEEPKPKVEPKPKAKTLSEELDEGGDIEEDTPIPCTPQNAELAEFCNTE